MVSDSLSSSEGGNGNNASTPLDTYTEKFEELFPYYLSLGMTEEQYWDRDCRLVVAYRKAEELRTNRKNSEMWLQGVYVYEAIKRVSPILHAFAKKGTKPVPYMEEPFSLTKEQADNKQRQRDKKVFDKGKAMMESFMVRHNQKYEGK